MSYCRAGGGSDVYAYASGHRCNFTIHCRDETYYEDDLPGFRARLEALRAQGLRVPQEAFDRIDRELTECNKSGLSK